MENKNTMILLVQLIIHSYFLTVSLSLSQADIKLTVGNGSGIPSSSDNPVEVSLENINDKVRGISIDLCDADNYLTCTGCGTTDRTPGFRCLTEELSNGCVRVILVSFSSDLIEEGEGPIFTLYYEVSEGVPLDTCVTIPPENEEVFDELGYSLSAFLDAGQFCFLICGDVYPRESLPDNPFCGDGVVDFYDVMEEIKFLMDIVEPSECQTMRANVPNGTPPYCHTPDGKIDILDALVIIDKAFGRANCCEY